MELQRTAQLSVELWIGEEAHQILRMRLDARFPITFSGPAGVEQRGSSGFSTMVRYSDFKCHLDQAPAGGFRGSESRLASGGQWPTEAKDSSPVLLLPSRPDHLSEL